METTCKSRRVIKAPKRFDDDFVDVPLPTPKRQPKRQREPEEDSEEKPYQKKARYYQEPDERACIAVCPLVDPFEQYQPEPQVEPVAQATDEFIARIFAEFSDETSSETFGEVSGEAFGDLFAGFCEEFYPEPFATYYPELLPAEEVHAKPFAIHCFETVSLFDQYVEMIDSFSDESLTQPFSNSEQMSESDWNVEQQPVQRWILCRTVPWGHVTHAVADGSKITMYM